MGILLYAFHFRTEIEPITENIVVLHHVQG